MKFINHRIFSLSCLLLCSINSVAQPRSQFNTRDLEVLCKIWGLVKYNHPGVQTGTYDLDLLLLKSFDDLEGGTSVGQIIDSWLTKIGEPKASKFYPTRDTVALSTLKWLKSTGLLSRSSVAKLSKMCAISTAKKYYVKTSKIGNIEIINEPKYTFADVANKNIRLLILFRFWNVIEYFYPYKSLAEIDWHSVIGKYIPVFIDANTKLAFQLAFLKLTVELKDSHAFFLTDDIMGYFGEKYLPAKFRIVNKQVVVTGSFDNRAAENNLVVGDIIFEVDGVSVQEKMRDLQEYTPGSNLGRKNYNYRYSLFNGSSDSVKLGIIRAQDTLYQSVGRFRLRDFTPRPEPKSKWEIFHDGILYVRVSEISGRDIKMLKEAMIKSNGLILDLRLYPKYQIHNRLMEVIKTSRTIFFRRSIPNLEQLGAFNQLAGNPSGPKGRFQYDKSIAVLVDERTISHGEFIVMDLQSCGNVTTFGTQTAGAIGFTSVFNVVEDKSTLFTGTGIYYPDGSAVQQVGNRIDFQVELTLEGVKRNEDEVLAAAVEFLSQRIYLMNHDRK